MTTVVFYKSNGVFYGFEEQGHTGYADEGGDVLCAALSAMTMLIINAVEAVYHARALYTIDEETTNIRLTVPAALPGGGADGKTQYAVGGLIKAYYLQLRELTDEYHGFLEVRETEKPAE